MELKKITFSLTLTFRAASDTQTEHSLVTSRPVATEVSGI